MISNKIVQRNILIGLIVLITTSVGLLYTGYYDAAAFFWPASGFYIALYYIYKKEVLPGILIGLLFTNIMWRITGTSEPLYYSILLPVFFVLSNFVAMLTFSFLIDRYKVQLHKLAEFKTGIWFSGVTIVAVMLAGVIATVGIWMFYGSSNLFDIYSRWVVGDFLGVLVFGSLVIDSYYKDGKLDTSLSNVVKSAIYITTFVVIIYFVFEQNGNDFITMENFQIAIIILYLVATFAFSYRMILVSDLIFLTMVYVLYLKGIPSSDFVTESVMISLYLVTLSSIAYIVKNILLERQNNYTDMVLARSNLEKVILSINNLFNIQNKLPEEIEEFSRRYLKDMFNLACEIYPKFSRASCYIKGDKYVDFVAASGYDVDFLNELNYDQKTFKWNQFSPEIIHYTDHKESIPTDAKLRKYLDEYGRIKESIRFSIKIGENYFGAMSFDIGYDTSESFDELDVETFESFQKLVNSYYSIGMMNTQNNSLKDDIVKSSVKTLELYDSYTESHSEEVSQLCLEIGRGLNLTSEDVRHLYWSALVHDIGKIGVSPEILNKKGKLSSDEFDLVKQHSVFGYDVLAKSSGLEPIAKTVRHHHERWDGKGYPDGLKAMEIPYPSQIINVCDAVSAMSSKRVYKDALPQDKIIRELENGLGTQFSPKVATFMIKYISEGKFTTFLKKMRKEDKQ